MQDPEAVAPYGPAMVWRVDTIGSDVRQLFGYDDMEQLAKGFPSKVRRGAGDAGRSLRPIGSFLDSRVPSPDRC